MLLWAASAGYLLWACAFIWSSSVLASDGHRYFCLFDDAMVSMRYAWNLAHGKGCVWNVGEYVQGFTNVLTVLLMALPCAVFSKSIACLAVQLFGAATVLGVAWYTRRLFARVCSNVWLSLMVFVSVLAYYPLSYWALMGMETGLLCLCLLAAIASAAGRSPVRCVAWLCLGFLTRPDFVIMAGLILAFLFVSDRRRAILGTGVLTAFAALVFACQYWYFGEALPNTYTLKMVGMSFGARVKDGASFVCPFLAGVVPLIAFAMAGTSPPIGRIKVLLLSILCAAMAYQIYIGGDPWPYWRMLVPVMPILILLALSGAHVLFRGNSAAASGAVAFGLVICTLQFVPEAILRAKPYKSDESTMNLETALVLNRVLPSGSTIGVEWAGALPYYTDFRAIDFLGKTDRHIARVKPDTTGLLGWSGMISVPGHNKYDLAYSIGELNPDYIQTWKYGHSAISDGVAQRYELKVVNGVEIVIRKGILP
jgi:arabinofuranosyltransferase